jgi:hypothetical protein
MSIFVAILSIFRRDIGRKYWATFKKAWGCVGRRLTFQKCETSFKQDIKNSILKKVLIKKPKLVKPISVSIEIIAVLIVALTAWSLIEATKAGLSIYALGTCNPSRPDDCAVSKADTCPIYSDYNWFEQWGAIFTAIPDKFKSWHAEDYLGDYPAYYNPYDPNKPTALDILDPGCNKCLSSFTNQLKTGFLDKYNVALLPYPIEGDSRPYRFQNSGLITRYLLATAEIPLKDAPHPAPWLILENIFTKYNDQNIIYQSVLNDLPTISAESLLQSWLTDFGYSPEDVVKITTLAHSESITTQIQTNKQTIDQSLHLTGIPTIIYNNKKHTGLFEKE